LTYYEVISNKELRRIVAYVGEMLHWRHMKKDILIGFGALLVVIAGCTAYALTRPATPLLPDAMDVAGLGTESYTEHADYYDIEAHYASSTPLLGKVGAEANAAAVGSMKTFVTDTIAEFKKNGNFDHLTAEDITMMGFDQGRKESLKIVYLMSSSVRTVSYIFTVYEDTLGAHGNMYFHTFTFDTVTGNELTLSSVFLPEYLTTLSSISRTELPRIMAEFADTSMIAEGTTPSEQNFQNFFFDNRDFVILFDPYQVAAYAAGPQTLRLPVSKIANILKPDYR
jgi:hypothetical protein